MKQHVQRHIKKYFVSRKKQKKLAGFTFLEIILVVAILGVFFIMLIYRIKPVDVFTRAFNLQTKVDVKSLERAILDYSIQNKGNRPIVFNDLDEGTYDICKQGSFDCTANSVNLDELITAGILSEIPVHPDNTDTNTTGYQIEYDPVTKIVEFIEDPTIEFDPYCAVIYSVNNTQDLSAINLANGIKTNIGTLSFGSSAAAIDPITHRIYYIERVLTEESKQLAYYDLTNNTNTVVGLTGSTKIIDKLAFHTNGTLYAMASTREFYTVDTTSGLATQLGTLNVTGGGGDLAFDQNGDLYVLLLTGNFYRIDTQSLVTTSLGNTTIATTGLIYKSDGFFYAAADADLYKFNLTTVTTPTLLGNDSDPLSNDLTNCNGT